MQVLLQFLLRMAQNVSEHATKLLYINAVLLSLSCITKSYVTDYLLLNVI